MLIFNRRNDALDVSLTGEIYPGIFEEFRAALAEWKPKSVTLELCSDGGSVIDAFAIYNALRGVGNVTITVTGWAASAATIILMAGDVIRMCANSFIMIHEPSLMLWEGNLSECRKAAGILETMRDTIAAAYAKRTKLDLEALKAMMHDETWLTAEEALAAGFADEITEAVEIAAKTKIPETLQEVMMGKKTVSAENAEEVKKPCAAEDPAPGPAPEPEKGAPEEPKKPEEQEPEAPAVEPEAPEAEEPDPVEELRREAEGLREAVETLKRENEALKEELGDLKDKAARAVAGLRVKAQSEAVPRSCMTWADALKDCGGDYQLARKKHPDSFGKMIADNR